MDIVLDSVSLNHLLRSPRRVRERFNETVGTPLDPAIADGTLKLAVDISRGLIDEWARTCGPEVVHVLVTKWESQNGILLMGPLGKLSSSQRSRLLRLGFTDACDKLIVKIAVATDSRTIVSDDSDFWDPKQKGNYCNPNAPVARILIEELGINIFVLKQLIAMILS